MALQEEEWPPHLLAALGPMLKMSDESQVESLRFLPLLHENEIVAGTLGPEARISVIEANRAERAGAFSDDFDADEARSGGCRTTPNVKYGDVYEHWPKHTGIR